MCSWPQVLFSTMYHVPSPSSLLDSVEHEPVGPELMDVFHYNRFCQRFLFCDALRLCMAGNIRSLSCEKSDTFMSKQRQNPLKPNASPEQAISVACDFRDERSYTENIARRMSCIPLRQLLLLCFFKCSACCAHSKQMLLHAGDKEDVGNSAFSSVFRAQPLSNHSALDVRATWESAKVAPRPKPGV